MLNLEGTPYRLDLSAEQEVIKQITQLEERVNLLREQGILTNETLINYYGQKRFEHVAESNAIEGSTLSVGETELAVLKGTTITGHDPAFTRDAIALDKALQELTEMAKNLNQPTDIDQLHKMHLLILGERPGAGVFRKDPVKISGASHMPPRSWGEIMDCMENWEKWSEKNRELAAPIRATVLHAWLAHIHPYIDGNGRTARAISNLELVRNGYPPVIIKKKERSRYIEALAVSDTDGNIGEFIELILEKVAGALVGLEISAKIKQGYNPLQEKIRKKQQQNLKIWETSIKLLVETLRYQLSEQLDSLNSTVDIKLYESSLDLDDYIALCDFNPINKSWAFSVKIQIPGIESLERLAYFGFRSKSMSAYLEKQGGPAVYWSIKNPAGYPKWQKAEDQAPYGIELTTELGVGDSWYVRRDNYRINKMSTTELAHGIAKKLMEQIIEGT